MENRLKADAVAEAARFGDRVLVSGETDDGQVVDIWIQVCYSTFVFQGPVAE